MGNEFNNQDPIIVKWSGGCRELHPKARNTVKDNNGVEHESVMAAYLSVVGEKKISFINCFKILVKIFMTMVNQNPSIKAILLATAGKPIRFEHNDPVEFVSMPGLTMPTWGSMPQDKGGFIGKNQWGTVINTVRSELIHQMEMSKYEQSTGAVPPNTQPCLRCGGHGQVAGTGYYLCVADGSATGWKHVGACFDCLPKGKLDRGLGYITRAKARHNWTYRTHNPKKWDESHIGCEANLYNPDDNNLWRPQLACETCGKKNGEGVVIFVGRNNEPTLCKPCFMEQKAEEVINQNLVSMDNNVEMPI